MDAIQSISKIINKLICDDKTCKSFLQRLVEGLITRDENPKSHFCIYFLPYNSETKKVFIVHHKKSGLWLSPGGHIDKGEDLLPALNREINEELGIKDFFKELPEPFLLTTTPIENTTQPCKIHFDIWFLVPTDGSNFNVNPEEFHNTKWLTIEDARKIIISTQNLKALDKINSNF